MVEKLVVFLPRFKLNLPVRQIVLMGGLLFALILALYWPVQQHGFVDYDDPQFIVENEHVRGGLSRAGLIYAFTETLVGNWHPVTTFSHQLDVTLFGINPGAFHLVNATIHAGNAALLCLLLWRLTGVKWTSGLTAALFALHPLRVESVAWISERKDVLCVLFGLISLLAYHRFTEGSRKRLFWYGLALGSFVLGLMSKAMLVTLPCLLLLLDLWPLRRVPTVAAMFTRSSSRLWLEKVPFFVFAGIFSWLTLIVQAKAGAMQVIDSVSYVERIANAVMSYWRYLGKMFWPTDLSVVYPHPSASYASELMWPRWQLVLGGFGLLALTAFAFLQFSRRPYFAVGWLWFLGSLVPVIGLVQVGEQAMADRYTYLPSIGLTLLVVWLFAEGASRLRIVKGLLWTFSILGMAGLAVASHCQILLWRDTTTLFAHAVAVTERNPSAYFGYGVGLEKQGRVAEAISAYQKALAIYPRYKKAHYNLGQIFRKQGQWTAAAAAYEAALAIDRDDTSVRLNLASVLEKLGRFAESVAMFNEVLQREPESFEALNNLAWILASCSEAAVRNGQRAVALAEKAVVITESRQPFFLGTLAAAYAEAGRFPEAIATAQKAIDLAKAANQPDIAARNAELLELYRAGKPYHEPAK